MTALADHAAGLVARGWHVFPVEPGGKRPCIDRWEERATTDREHVAAAWRERWAGSNIGIACGPSGLVVIDLDTRKPGTGLPATWQAELGIVDGSDVFATLAERAGQVWPLTYWVRTPSGGHHLYFAALPGRDMRNTAGKLGPMIDTRARGGYVVAAGSVIGGQVYDLIDGSAPVPLPAWLADLLDPPQLAQSGGPNAASRGLADRVAARLDALIASVLDARPGERNNLLHWAACRAAEMVAAGQLDPCQVHDALGEAAQQAGLPTPEAERTIASALRRGAA
jgi:Bifunctional DNA primase/polymerase, N-terminal